MYHSRKTRKTYDSRLRTDGAACSLCVISDMESQKIDETALFYVIKNRTKYDYWELSNVDDHLMVVPKRHVEGLAGFTDTEKLDYMKILATYETKGFNVYARRLGNPRRSVQHQHTHLIKDDGKEAIFTAYLRKPYGVIRFQK